MFEFCRFVNRDCAMAGTDSEGQKRCGTAKGGNNYIDTMTTCPIADNRAKIQTRESWKLRHYTVVEMKKQSEKELKIKRKKIAKKLGF